MKICIHRGAKQIGGSCVEVIASGKRIIVDIGLPLDYDKIDEKYLPEITGLDGNDSSLLSVLISHSHLDHFGLLRFVNKKIRVIMGKDAYRILEKTSPFLPAKLPKLQNVSDLRSRVPIYINPFKITPFLIDHSAYDAYSFLIEAEGKCLFYSGDFRMHGRKVKLTKSLMSNPPKNIDVMLLEGSNISKIERLGLYQSEGDIENRIKEAIKNVKGLVMIHTSSQNIDRIVSIFKACKATGKKLVIDLYTAVVLEATGNKKIPQSNWPEIALYIPHSQRIQIKNNNGMNY